MSGDKETGRGRRVEWDEDNLEKNAEYQRLHPVTIHIDEPKTPYVYIDDDVAEAMDRGEEPTWDPKVNALAHQVKLKTADDRAGAPHAPVSKTGRPMLHPGTVTGELEEVQHERQFKQMRKAVYADEGAKFKALLAKQHGDEEDEKEEENGKAKQKDSLRSEKEHLTDKQKHFKEKGVFVHMPRVPDADGVAHHTVASKQNKKK